MTECENSNRNYSRAYDMIISNPPYIPTAEIEGLMEEVRLHDREWLWMAWRMVFISTGPSPDRQRIILPRVAGSYMRSDAAREKMWLIFYEKKGYEDIEIRQDLCGLDRVVLGRKKLQEEKYV